MMGQISNRLLMVLEPAMSRTSMPWIGLFILQYSGSQLETITRYATYFRISRLAGYDRSVNCNNIEKNVRTPTSTAIHI